MKTIELTKEQYKALCSDEPVIIQPPKKKVWEPQKGDWRITPNGEVTFIHSTTSYKLAGAERTAKDLAEQAAKRTVKTSRLSALVDELDTNWKVNWDDKYQHKYYLIYDHGIKEWEYCRSINVQRIESIFMSEGTALRICKMLNSREVIL